MPDLGKRVAAVLGVLALLAAFAVALSTPEGRAAPCPAPSFSFGGGDLSIQGTPPCAEETESFVVHCEAGTVRFEYGVNGVSQGEADTEVGCGSPARISVHANAGDDVVDLSKVIAANGFTGIARPNLLEGGSGMDELVGSRTSSEFLAGTQNDIILARNGVHDTVDCGQGTDAVQADQAGVDSLSNCELMDLLPTPAIPAPAASVPTPTGKRAAAQRRCHRIMGRKARRRCFRHARTLPI